MDQKAIRSVVTNVEYSQLNPLLRATADPQGDVAALTACTHSIRATVPSLYSHATASRNAPMY